MKILINKTTLETIINNTSSYIEKKDISSITSHIYLNAKDGILEVKATDYEIGLFYKIKNIKILDEGIATANGKKILDIIRALKDEDITLETMNNYLYIRQRNSKFKLPMYNSTDFPSFPDTTGKKKFEIDSMLFTRSIKKISSSIDANNPNYALNGALIDVKENYINLVGTDTKRLSIFKIETKTQNEPDSFILPKKSILEMQKIIYDKVEFYYDQTVLVAVCDSFEFYTKLLNGKYPNYQRVVPSDIKQTLTLPRDKFLDGMKTIAIVCDKMSITLKPNSILFESINDDNSEAKTEIECATNIDQEIKINITNKQVMDFLNVLEENIFTFGYNDSATPFLLKSGELMTIVVPTII